MEKSKTGAFSISLGSPERNNFSKGIGSHPNSVSGRTHTELIPKKKDKVRPAYDKGKLGK